jgi:O-antigen/teichoic acid export membrane protein
MFAKIFYLVSRLVLPPLVLAHVSLADYGLWSASFVLIMYIGLTDVGFSNVYVRFTARYHTQGDTEAINRLLSTGVLTLTLLSIGVFAALSMMLPFVLDFLKVASNKREMASILVLGTSAMFLLDLTLGAYCYLLHGLQRIREEQKVAVIGYVLELVLIAAFLQADFGVYSLLIAFVLRYTWSLTSFMRLAHKFLPELKIRLRYFDRSMLRHFFGFGLAVQASALLGTALFSIDRVIAGYLLGPQGIALFELASKLPVAANSVPSVISNITMPAASRLNANNDVKGIQDIFRKSSRSISLLASIPLGFMVVFSNPISSAWLGHREELQFLPLILTLTAIWSHIHIITGPGSSVFRALGQVGNEFVYHVLRIVCLAIGISSALLMIGTTGTALAIGLCVGSVFAALGYLLFNQRKMDLSAGQLFRETLAPGWVAYPVAFALLWLWHTVLPTELNRLESIALLLVFGVLYCVILGFVLWKWILNIEERERLAQILGQVFSSIKKRKKA